MICNFKGMSHGGIQLGRGRLKLGRVEICIAYATYQGYFVETDVLKHMQNFYPCRAVIVEWNIRGTSHIIMADKVRIMGAA